MKRHHHRITVEPLTAIGQALSDRVSLAFVTSNHDDLLEIVEKLRARNGFDADTATAFAVGLKLFSEVMLQNRQHLLFAALQPHFAEFMKGLKKAPRAALSGAIK